MDDSMTWVKTWEQLYKEFPEARDASTKHWYTVPGASKSAFHESKMPNGVSGAYRLGFMMCQLAQSEWYAHKSLDELAEEAAQFIADDKGTVEERQRAVWAERLAPHQALRDALNQGLDSVYTLAGLTPAQIKMAQYMMAGTPDEVIQDLMGYQDTARSGDDWKVTGARRPTKDGKLMGVRRRKSEVIKKLQSIIKEEKA